MNVFLVILIVLCFSGALICFFSAHSDENMSKFYPHLLIFSFLILLLRISRIWFSDYIFSGALTLTGLASLVFYWLTHEQGLKNKLMSLLSLFLIFLGTCSMAYHSFLSESHEKTVFNDELFYAKSAGFVLGEHLANTYPKSQVLIIVDNKDEPSKFISAGLDGLLKGLKKSSHVVAIDSLDITHLENNNTKPERKKKISPEGMINLIKKSKASAFDNVVSKYPECNLIISLIGLPENLQDMNIWSIEENKRPKIALLRANANQYAEAVYSKAIIALVSSKPVLEPIKSKQKNMKIAFEERFLLLTPENIVEIAEKNPELFHSTSD